ncbi:RNA-binding protein 25 [Anopheles cruzii]|uniref:RNA-binding protein 25 n=1 Tax=Anopheles cruzii TaxID=68878 RepID=UPI0022EC535A|nr:RNA-binding protein 25 [Anopheles cruzii]
MAATEEFTVDQQKREEHPNRRSSTSMDDRGQPSSSQRDRSGRHGEDNRSHHRDRERNRDRDYSSRYRDRDRDRDRDRRGGDRHKDREDDSERRYRERHRRERHGSRSPVDDRREKSRKRSKSRDRDHYSQRSDRSAQNRLSEEIENELANLRRQHELKEAMRKQQNPDGESSDESKQNQADPYGPDTAIRRSQTAAGAAKPNKPKLDFLSVNQKSAPVEYVPEIQTEEERIEFQRKMQAKLQQHLAAEGKLYPPPAKPREPAPPVVVSGFANDGSFLEMFKQLQQQPIVAANASFGVVAPFPATGTVPAAAVAATVPFVDTNPVAAAAIGSSIAPTLAGVSIAQHTTLSPLVQPFKMVPGAPAARPSTLVVAQSIAAPVAKPTPKEPPPPPLPVFGRRRGGKILKTGMVKKVRPVEETASDAPNDAWSLYLQEVKKYKSASCDADSKTRPLVK